HDRRMIEPPATPDRERWLHIVRDGESESAPPAPADDPSGEPRRPPLPSVFSRTPPGGPNHGGWAPPDPTGPTPRRTPTGLPDSGRAHGGPTDAASGTVSPSTLDTVRPAGYGPLAEPPPGPRPGAHGAAPPVPRPGNPESLRDGGPGVRAQPVPRAGDRESVRPPDRAAAGEGSGCSVIVGAAPD